MNITNSLLNFDENELETICNSDECYLSSLTTGKKSETENYLNYERFNSVLDFGFGKHQTLSTHKFTEGLYGMFFSPGFGLITNFPLILLIPFAAMEFVKKEKILFLCFLDKTR